jgi:hypothetical protein
MRSDIPFSTALYKDIYEDHVRCLIRFDELTKEEILSNILLKLYNRGRYYLLICRLNFLVIKSLFSRFHAGAQPLSTATKPTISDSAFIAALKEYEEEDKTESDGENGDSD